MSKYKHPYYPLILKLSDIYQQRNVQAGKYPFGPQFIYRLRSFIFNAADDLSAASDSFSKLALLNLFDELYGLNQFHTKPGASKL